MIAAGVIMINWPDDGYRFVVLIICAALTLRGIRTLVYYFTMARYMVGGKTVLYRGVLILDLGMFTFAMADIPRVYVLLYLIACHAITGIISLLRGREARAYESPQWRSSMIRGAINLVIAAACLLFIRSANLAVYVYAAGLFTSAFERIVLSFRRTAIAYIP